MVLWYCTSAERTEAQVNSICDAVATVRGISARVCPSYVPYAHVMPHHYPSVISKQHYYDYDDATTSCCELQLRARSWSGWRPLTRAKEVDVSVPRPEENRESRLASQLSTSAAGVLWWWRARARAT